MCAPSLKHGRTITERAMTLSTSKILLIATVGCCLQQPTVAHAHDLPTERGVVVQMGESQAHVLVSFQDPRKERVRLIYKRYDLNGDGKLDEKESKLAAKLLLPIALQGVQFEVPGLHPAAHDPQIKIKRTKKGELIMLALVSYTLPKWQKPTPRQFKVTVKKTRNYPALQVTFMAVEGVQLKAINPPKLTTIRPGQHLTATFEKKRTTTDVENLKKAPKK